MKKLLQLLAFLLPVLVIAQPTSATFTSSGNYVIPAGYSANLKIEAWGGGGSGGTGTGRQVGGGGGGYGQITNICLGEGSYAVVVGAGGSAGAGGTSSFQGAIGGGGTALGVGGAGTGDISFSGGTGGTPGSGTNGGGGGGGSATSAAAGGNGATSVSGIGGAGGAGQGNGGKGANTSGANPAIAGSSSGGGGGGRASTTNTVSAAGGAGQVIITVTSVLPVRMVTFIADKNILSFTTASEKNNSHFVVERSKDGSNFQAIGQVKGNGYSNEVRNYTFEDKKQVSGQNYYRLKQVDFDGRFEYSKVVSSYVGNKVFEATVVSAQSDLLRLNVFSQISDEASISVYDMNGRMISTQNVTLVENDNEISLASNLLNGIYVIKIATSNGEQISKMLNIR